MQVCRVLVVERSKTTIEATSRRQTGKSLSLTLIIETIHLEIVFDQVQVQVSGR
jgi:hypothetical protein